MSAAPTLAPTLAQALAEALAGRGVRRIFGVPGGGSSLDVIDAAGARGIDFVLTQGETAAAIMAAVTAELSGTPGVVLTGIGPGIASAVNGVAYAALERAPLLLLADCAEDAPDRHALHQRFDQGALMAPLVKASRKLAAADGPAAVEALLELALEPPRGAVHADLSARQAATPVAALAPPRPAARPQAAPTAAELAAARALLATSERPVIVAGLEAREADACEAARGLLDALDCPALTTYKAKGVIADADPRLIGHMTGGAAEADCLERADLILFFGLDPVELIPHRWRYAAPVLELSIRPGPALPVAPAATLIGPLAGSAAGLMGLERRPGWPAAETAALRAAMRARLQLTGSRGRTTQEVVETAAAAAPNRRVTVDSGAHMLSAMGLWQAQAPFDVLKSNGLSTMGFALPAAIAAALEAPERPVIAFTGDAGLMMCLGELATAARLGCRIVVIALNDAALSLIDIKQQAQGRPPRGVRYPAVDLAAAARALGCRAWPVPLEAPLEPVLAEALAADGPALLDVAVDPAGYGAQLAALRG